MKLPKIRLQPKLLTFFILISLIPFIISNIIWFNSTRTEIISSTAERLNLVASQIARQLEEFLLLKKTVLTIHSQTETIKGADVTMATEELKGFLNQDTDIEELSLLTSNGKELVRVTQNRVYPPDELIDQSSSPAFRIPSLTGGESYISSIYFDETGQPSIYISVPIIKPNKEIFGIVKANYHLTSLWKLIESLKIGQNGYIFVVDDKGNVIAHPNSKLAKQQQSLRGFSEVEAFLKHIDISDVSHDNQQEVVNDTTNEFGIHALTIHNIIKLTNWGVIAQVPISDTFLETNKAALFAVILVLVFLVVVILLSLWLSKQIVKPIEDLRLGSDYIGAGDLNYRLDIKSGDEIEKLGQGFNHMAEKLQDAFQKLALDKNLIIAERNKLAVALSSIADAVIAVDLSRNITIFNRGAEDLTGISASDAISQPLGDIIKIFDGTDELSTLEYCPIVTDVSEGVIFSMKNLRMISLKNREAYIGLVVAGIREGQTANLGCILTLHDITKEKQLEEMRLDFVSMAAHELRTPLTSIKGYLSVFMHENSKNLSIQQNTFLERIAISTQQLNGLVDNLLSVSRIEKGVFTVRLQPTDWVLIVSEQVAEFTNRAKEKMIQLSFTKPSQLIPKVIADKIRITEVLSNLLSNAISYTQHGGEVKVTLEAKNNEVITHIQDNGPGIPKDAIPHLFTKFFRVSGILEQGSKGTGLGLYISKAIVELHKGRIWVDSETGKGSVFSFSLPV